MAPFEHLASAIYTLRVLVSRASFVRNNQPSTSRRKSLVFENDRSVPPNRALDRAAHRRSYHFYEDLLS